MKRRISTEQLQELTPEQQERLREWWKPEYGDYYLRVTVKGVIDSIPFLFNVGDLRYTNYKEFKIPQLDIGQMIELLRVKDFNKIVELDYNGAIQSENLCDILWEAVKAVL